MDDLEKSQNKLFRLLNNTRIKDKIKTKSIAQNLKMLSVNQINAQVKLTEMWKAQNIEDYPIQNEVQIPKIDNSYKHEEPLYFLILSCFIIII